MRSCSSALLRLIQRVTALFVLIVWAPGCGDDPVVDAGPDLDGGVSVDTGLPTGPDQDLDEWTDDIDNCPSADNPGQRDRDGDGIGDDCDSCPATPNSGAGGLPGQADCMPVDEAEPNDQANQAEPIGLLPAGSIREVRGTIESPAPGQAFDRYQLMLAAGTLLQVRIARSSSASLLEPYFEVAGGGYTVPRSAQGLFVASRQIYAAEAGTYVLSVADRRGAIEAEPKGSPSYGYALSIEVVDAQRDGLTPPFSERPFTLQPAGKIGLYQVELEASPFSRIQAATDYADNESDNGLDPVLVVERADGTVIESSDLAPGFLGARVVLELADDETVKIAVDHAQIFGEAPDLEVRLTVDQPDTRQELEPNDLSVLASALVFPGETSGVIGPPVDPDEGPPDLDWYSFDGQAGQVIAITGLIRPSSQVDPIMALVTFDGDLDELQYISVDSSGNAPYLECVLPDTRTYHLVVSDDRNVDMPPYVGGPLFTYGLYAEVIGIQPDPIVISTSTAFSGALDPGGRVGRHLIVASEPTLIDLRITSGSIQPGLRVYGPGARGQIGAGLDRALAFLPGAETYVFGVQDIVTGAGGPGVTYAGQVEYLPLPGVDESEPNDAATTEDRLSPTVDVARGELLTDSDVDRFVIQLPTGTLVTAQLGIGYLGRTVAFLGAAGVIAMGEGGVTDVPVTSGGDFVFEITGRAGPYTLAIRAD